MPETSARTIQFLVDAEVRDGGPNYEKLVCYLSDALTFVDGVGHVEITYLGDIVEDPRDTGDSPGYGI